MKFRYLGFVTCWWASSYIFVICYLVGECCFQTYISTQPLLELSAHLFKSFLQGFGNVIAPANISAVCWLFGMSFRLNEMARQQRMIERELMRMKSYPTSIFMVWHRWYALQEMNDRRFHIKYLVRIKYSASNAKFPTNINLQYEKYVCLLFQLPIQNYYLFWGGYHPPLLLKRSCNQS